MTPEGRLALLWFALVIIHFINLGVVSYGTSTPARAIPGAMFIFVLSIPLIVFWGEY